ncbi:hypothetical protein PoB_002645600 [Plakobranchus ocellatus]|uniref:Uncharacterized protein n=1 Tax=Plakobranchus ocellatus TaxID=259542 RepID=A0AAV3ZLG4_9GAST|nr:hypothetical protein PoB_002645600 [Plakobranchus ocellatus]
MQIYVVCSTIHIGRYRNNNYTDGDYDDDVDDDGDDDDDDNDNGDNDDDVNDDDVDDDGDDDDDDNDIGVHTPTKNIYSEQASDPAILIGGQEGANETEKANIYEKMWSDLVGADLQASCHENVRIFIRSSSHFSQPVQAGVEPPTLWLYGGNV